MICRFTNQFSFLSNFYYHSINYQGDSYKTNEHVYQASKFLLNRIRDEIRKANTPSEIKFLANKVYKNLQDRDFYKYKLQIMYNINKIKFSDEKLSELLISTYPNKLIEGNTWGDTFWGCTFNENGVFRGENNLGLILERIRHERMEFSWIIIPNRIIRYYDPTKLLTASSKYFAKYSTLFGWEDIKTKKLVNPSHYQEVETPK